MGDRQTPPMRERGRMPPRTAVVGPTFATSPVPLLCAVDARIENPRIDRDPGFVRVRPGVYAPRDAFTALPPSGRYLTRVHAFALRNPDAVLAGPSSCAVRALPVLGRPRLIHVHDPSRAASRRYGDVVVHTSDDTRTIEAVEGMWTTAAADTVLDSIRTLAPAAGVALTDAAVRRHGSALLERVGDLADAQVSSRGLARIRVVLPLVDPRSESVGETASRVATVWLGFDAPQLQVGFPWDGGVDRVDHWWPTVRAIGEFDGEGKYLVDGPLTTRERVLAEKERENRLRRRCRGFERWDWSDVMAVHPLEQRLLALGVPRPHPPRSALLHGIRRESF